MYYVQCVTFRSFSVLANFFKLRPCRKKFRSFPRSPLSASYVQYCQKPLKVRILKHGVWSASIHFQFVEGGTARGTTGWWSTPNWSIRRQGCTQVSTKYLFVAHFESGGLSFPISRELSLESCLISSKKTLTANRKCRS